MMYNDHNMQQNLISNPEKQQSGNALIYVLIAIALFAALSFVLRRQTDTSEAGVVNQEQTELYAAQLISYSAQVKSSVEQMLFSGAFPEELTFFVPGDAHYDNEATYRNIYKIFHPAGGGLSIKPLPPEIRGGNGSEPSPDPGWYLGRFNNVEWTKTASADIILVAYKITRPVCEAINDKITGSSAIPVLNAAARDYFVYRVNTTPQHTVSTGNGHSGVANADLTETACADCKGYPSLCVTNNNGNVYAFYSVITEG